MATELFAGPIDYIVFAFPKGAPVEAGFQALLDRVDSGITEILDVSIVGVNEHGVAEELSFADVYKGDVSQFEGIQSGIIKEEDRATIAAGLDSDTFAIAIVYEDRSLSSAAAVWAQSGGRELLSGGIDLADLEEIIAEGETK